MWPNTAFLPGLPKLPFPLWLCSHPLLCRFGGSVGNPRSCLVQQPAGGPALATAFDGLTGFFDPGNEYVLGMRFGPVIG
jgi:hypothetical protein